MEIMASSLADNIDRQAGQANHSGASLSVPVRALAQGRQVIISNNTGEIVAKFPPNIEASGTLMEHFGPAQALTTFAEKAGVMHIALANGEDTIAHVQNLSGPLGQMALVHPVSAILAEWQMQVVRTFIGFVATVAVILMLTAAFLWQAKRASSAETGCDRMQDRIDTALSRGHCGL